LTSGEDEGPTYWRAVHAASRYFAALSDKSRALLPVPPLFLYAYGKASTSGGFVMPKGPKGEKRPADVIGNAVHVMRIATGEITENPLESARKS
jgi:hypothetical protein